MNIKTIILITFVLLGILTLGTVSATDDVVSDNMTATALEADDLADSPIYDEKMLACEDNNDSLSIKEEPTLSKTTPSINIEANDGVYGEEVSLNVTLPSDATGNVSLYIDDIIKETLIVGGKANFILSGLSCGEKDVMAIYSGDLNYEARNITCTLTILKAEPTMEIDVLPTMVYGEETTISITLSGNATGNVILTIANANKTLEITNGTCKYVDSRLAAGIYNVTARYYGDENYAAVTNSIMFEILKANITGNVSCTGDITVEDNATILIVTYAHLENVTLSEYPTIMVLAPNDFTGNVSVYINGKIYKYNLPVPSFIELNKLLAGSYFINVKFYGDNNYNNKSYMVNLRVSRVTPPITVRVEDATYPNNVIVEAIIGNSANGTVKIYLNSSLIKSTNIIDGILNTSLSGLNGGMHDVLITFESMDYYNNDVNATASFRVNPANTTIIITINGTDVTATLTDAHGPLTSSVITFYINGHDYYRMTDSNGKSTLEDALTYGTNNITAIYSGNENYNGSESNLLYNIMDPTSFEALQQLINDAISGDNIKLTTNYKYKEDSDFAFISGIIIDKNLSIDGDGHIIDGKGMARIFNIISDNVVLSNLNLTKGFFNSSGGTIYWNGANGSIINTNISYSFAQNGGSIYWRGENGYVSSCIFNTSFANRDGGAIYWDNANSKIMESIFINSTSKNGGSIYVNRPNVQISNCYFDESKATTSGGAIYLNSDNSSIISSYFTNSRASSGGAIYVSGNNVSIIDSNFKASTASSSGGAIHINGANDKLIGSNFYGSTASSGGAVYWSYHGEENLIEKCTLTNNIATGSNGFGGALRSSSSTNSTITINNSIFTNNSANRGGAISGLNFNTIIKNSDFTHNTAVKQGGAIRDEGSNVKSLLIYNSTFKYNNCTNGHGGAVSLKNRNTIFSSCTFIGNEASFAGSISLKESDCSNAIIDKCSFIDSYAFDNENCSESGSGGGAIACWATDPFGKVNGVTNITITNSNFTNCKSRVYGGGAIEYLTSRGILENLTFTGCSAPYGGALSYASYDNLINNLKFIDCNSNGNGGSIYIGQVVVLKKSGDTSTYIYNPSNSTLSNIQITNSQAHTGGAIYIGNGTNISISDLTVNSSREIKGEIISGNSNVPLDIPMPEPGIALNGSTYFNGSSNINGSGFDNPGNPSIVIITSYAKGGAIYIKNGRNILISDSLIRNSQADYGGAIFIDENSTNVYINNTQISNSNTTANGGAIYVDGDNCTINNSTFTNNRANNKGGSIYWAGDDGILTNSSFDGSTASESGGAIYWEGDRGNVENTNFIHSSAVNGGAIYVEADKTVLLKQSNFGSNHAEKGSAIYNGIHINCAFSDNDNIIVYPIEKLETTTTVNIDKDSIIIGDSVIISIRVTSKNGAVNGLVDLYINDELNSTVDINKAVHYKPANAGTYTIYARYNGDDEDYLESESITKTITVVKKNPKVDISYKDIPIGENETISITLPSDAKGTVNITLFKNNRIIDNYMTDNISRIVKTQYSNLNFGVYTVNVKYSGDSQYNGFNRNVAFVVRPDVIITQNVTKGGDVTIYADLINDTGNVIIILDGEDLEYVKINQNKINFTFSTENIPFGNHTINFEYRGKNFKDENIFNTWDEKTNTLVPKDFELYIASVPQEILTSTESTPNEASFKVEMEKDAKGVVEFYINGEKATVVSIVNGIAIFDASKYKNGNYIITWRYSGDDKYASSSGSSALTVNIIPPKIVARDMKVTYSEGKKYSVTVYDNNGRMVSGTRVTFLINNKAIGSAKTNSKGVASITISKTPGSYEITSKALGVSVTKKLTVTHIISIKKVSVKKSAKKLILTATLKKVNGKYLKGKKITFKFNGKKYTSKTNKKGVAKVTIKKTVLSKLKVGKKVNYQASYLKDTVKQNVKVKK